LGLHSLLLIYILNHWPSTVFQNMTQTARDWHGGDFAGVCTPADVQQSSLDPCRLNSHKVNSTVPRFLLVKKNVCLKGFKFIYINYTIIESLRLENTSKIIKSNRHI